MNFDIYLPVAGMSMNIALLLGLGCIVGFLSGLFGVGGGFLMTPLLIIMGVPPTVAAASDSNQIVAASTSGTYAHARGGTVDFKMGAFLLVGGITGGTLGVRLIKFFRATGKADMVIVLFYVVMLALIGGYMFYDSLQGLLHKAGEDVPGEYPEKTSTYARIVNALPFRTNFKKSGVALSAFVPLIFGVLVGVLAAIMGVGGGFIMVPVMLYLLRMPMHVVVGTSLFQILFTCINVTVMQSWMNHTVDFILALMLLIGSVIGAQIGARVSRKLNADQLKVLLAIIVLLVMLKMAWGMFSKPDILVSYKGGH